jgi:hypothetical protein
MSPSQIIVLATPVFFVLIAIELAIGTSASATPTGWPMPSAASAWAC